MLKAFINILRRVDRIQLIILFVMPILAVSILLFSGSNDVSGSICERIKPLLFAIHENTQTIKTSSSLSEVQHSVDQIQTNIDKLRDALNNSKLSDAKSSLKRQVIDSYIRSYEYFLSYFYSTQIDEEDLTYSNFGLFIKVKDPSRIYEDINCVSEEDRQRNKERMANGDKTDRFKLEGKETLPYGVDNFVESIKRNYEFALWSSLVIFLTSALLSFLIYRSSRSDPRYDTHVDTTINYDDQEFPIAISNISKGGATIGPDYGFKQGDMITIKIEDKDLEAEIRWIWDAHAGIKFEKKIGKSTVKRLTVQPNKDDNSR